MYDGGSGWFRPGLGLAGGATPASDSVVESGEASQTGAGQTGSTTVPFEVVRRPEFVFDPFLGSLIQLPAMKLQPAQSSEFFLPLTATEGETRAFVGVWASLVTPEVETAPVAEEATVPVEQEPALPLPLSAASLTTRLAEREEAVEPELPVTQPVGEVAQDHDAGRAPWEKELAEALLAQTPTAEREKSHKKEEKLSLAMRFQRWLLGDLPEDDGDHRRAERVSMQGLVAFYWSGGTPKPHEIVNISRTGFYLRTTELWALETLVRMTLQRPASDEKQKRESISVLARVVRIDKGGVGHEFVTTEALMAARSLDVMPSTGTNWRELDRFLEVK